MRPIDADKVIQSIDMQMIIARKFLSNDLQYQEFISIVEQGFKQEIINAPTVKVIPISWIDSYITDSEIELNSNDPDKIRLMLEDWSKENGQETTNGNLSAVKRDC